MSYFEQTPFKNKQTIKEEEPEETDYPTFDKRQTFVQNHGDTPTKKILLFDSNHQKQFFPFMKDSEAGISPTFQKYLIASV